MKNKKLAIGMCMMILLVSIVYASTFSDNSQSDFNNGTYYQTFYNSSGFTQLNATYTTGSYTSKVFDAGGDATWNNISWVSNAIGELPNNKEEDLMGGNVLLLHMNEADGIIVDDSENGNNGTYNGALYSQPGKLNTAIGFDGVDDYVDAGNVYLPTSIGWSVTWELWAKQSSYVSDVGLLDKYVDENGKKSWKIYVTATNEIGFRMSYDGWDSAFITSSNNCGFTEDDTWTHIVVKKNGITNLEFYKNGILCDTKTSWVLGYGLKSTIYSLNIGRRKSSPKYFNGTIDEVAIYNRALSATEILDIYKRGILRLNLTARSCDDASCSGENWTDINDTSPQDLSLSNNQYFQYKFEFETDNASYTPELYNVTVDYTVLNAAPNTPVLNAPSNNSNLTVNYVLLNTTLTDPDGDNMTVYFFGNGSIINTTENVVNGSTITYNWVSLGDGNYNWSVTAGDGTANTSSSTYFFTIDYQVSIINASRLDKNNNSEADILEKVQTQDGTSAVIPKTKSLYIEFAKNLTNNNTISIYAKPNLQEEIYIYEAETGKEVGGTNLVEKNEWKWYNLTLNELTNTTNTFHIVSDSNIHYDYVIALTSETVSAIKITDAGGNLSFVLEENESIDVKNNSQYEPKWVVLKDKENKRIAKFKVHFENAKEDINLGGIQSEIDFSNKKSFIHYNNWSNHIGYSKVLYIPSTGVDSVYICPNATSLEEINTNCPGKIEISVGQTVENIILSTTTIGNDSYYIASGITDTGGAESSSSSSTDSPGGGGGGYSCTSVWRCTVWSECYSNGTRTRICTDIGNCRVQRNKPNEVENCLYIPPEEPVEKIKEEIAENITEEIREEPGIEEKPVEIEKELIIEKPSLIRKVITSSLLVILISLLFIITARAFIAMLKLKL